MTTLITIIWIIACIIGFISLLVAVLVLAAWFQKPIDRFLDATLGRICDWAERHGR